MNWITIWVCNIRPKDNCIFTSFCMNELVAWWIAHGSHYLSLWVALSITWHVSVFLSIQLNNIYLQSEYSIVLSCAQQSNQRESPKRVGSIILVCKSNPSFHLFVSKHPCLFCSTPSHPTKSTLPTSGPPNSYLNQSENTLLHLKPLIPPNRSPHVGQ